MNLKLLVSLLYILTCNVYANIQLVLEPLPQSTKNTCQSYSIAYAIANSGLWHESIDTPQKLRLLEMKFREAIESYVKEQKRAGKSISVYHHTAWVEALKRVSSNNLTLALYYPSSPNDFYSKIAKKTGNVWSGEFGDTFSAALVNTPVMTSVKRIGKDNYSSGHIVTVLGLTSPIPSNASLSSFDRKLLTLNSAVKANQQTFNMCSDDIKSGDRLYSASISSTANYELKNWNGKYLLMWVKRNS